MKKQSITKAAREQAKRLGLTPMSQYGVIRIIRAIRKDLLARGVPDHCDVVARELNQRKIIRGWYRTGTAEFTKYDVRDVWYRHYKREWIDWEGKSPGRSKRKPRKLIAKKKISYGSPQAELFCQANPPWRLLPRPKFLKLVQDSAIEGYTTDAIALTLNRLHILRPNYLTGKPEWNQSSLSNVFKALNGGVGLREVVAKAGKGKQLPLFKPAQKTPSSVLKTDDREAMVVVRTITTEVRLPMTDPTVVAAIQTLQNSLPKN